MRQFVSSEVDDLLLACAQFPWKPKHLAQLAPDVTSLPELTRQVLFMRIANALEDQLDFASQFSAKKHCDDVQAKPREEWGIEIGMALGHEALATEWKDELNKVAWGGRRNVEETSQGFVSSGASFSPGEVVAWNAVWLSQCHSALQSQMNLNVCALKRSGNNALRNGMTQGRLWPWRL